MIEKCFKCDGQGTQRVMENTREWASNIYVPPKFKIVPCSRCLGSGAVNYEIVKTGVVEISNPAVADLEEE